MPVGTDFSLAPGTRFGAIVESLGAHAGAIVVERAMYWNAAGVIWARGLEPAGDAVAVVAWCGQATSGL